MHLGIQFINLIEKHFDVFFRLVLMQKQELTIVCGNKTVDLETRVCRRRLAIRIHTFEVHVVSRPLYLLNWVKCCIKHELEHMLECLSLTGLQELLR